MNILEASLSDGSIDFYLGAALCAEPAPGLQMQHLFDNSRAVLCRQEHPLAKARSLKALAKANWAVTAADDNAEDCP